MVLGVFGAIRFYLVYGEPRAAEAHHVYAKGFVTLPRRLVWAEFLRVLIGSCPLSLPRLLQAFFPLAVGPECLPGEYTYAPSEEFFGMGSLACCPRLWAIRLNMCREQWASQASLREWRSL